MPDKDKKRRAARTVVVDLIREYPECVTSVTRFSSDNQTRDNFMHTKCEITARMLSKVDAPDSCSGGAGFESRLDTSRLNFFSTLSIKWRSSTTIRQVPLP
jgi:hypothetical protein